ncbi:hypothetical protein PsalN5692_04043 (plasmid) [Piscirickettsia salmonis]|uniref:pyocin knob domain-containing protein n=1 Tax=Piscirickettsia salmonis TaxID=1238 RepID=UPI0012B856A5|nr:pyocin knob domain-containing protein [Piscirickettsia salmonis]QGP52534.1 hypothetical protein PsalN5692_04043 [Piscirickettsia salmonis]
MSLERPTTYPDFAMKDCTDPISGQPNVEAIPQTLIDYGYAFRDKPEFNKFNYIFRSVAQWIRYVDEVTQSFGYLPFNFGQDATTTTSLIFGYLQGSVTQNNESITVPAGTVALTASTTNIVYVDLTDTTVKATASELPDNANDVELYEITTDDSQITNIVDKRTWINETASHQISWGNSSVAVKSQNGEVDINVAGSTVFKATNSQVVSNNPFKPLSGVTFADNTTQNTAAYNLPEYDGTARALSPDDDLNNVFTTGIYCGIPKNNPINDTSSSGEWFNFFIIGDGKKSSSQFAIPWSNLSRGVCVRTTQNGTEGWSEWERLNTQDKIYSDGKSKVSFDSNNAICFYFENKKVASINDNGLIFNDGSIQNIASPAVAKDYNGDTCGIYVDSLGDWNLVNQTGFFICTNRDMENSPTLDSTKDHWWTANVVRVPNSPDLTQTITGLAVDGTSPTFVRIYTESAGWTPWHRMDNTPNSIQSETLSRKQKADGSLQIELLIDQLYPIGKLELTFDENYIPPFQGKGATWKRVTDIDADHAGRLLTIAGSNNFAVNAGEKAGSIRTNDHTLSVDEIPNHSHEYSRRMTLQKVGHYEEEYHTYINDETEKTSSVGGGKPHSHGLDPARSGVIVWERTA